MTNKTMQYKTILKMDYDFPKQKILFIHFQNKKAVYYFIVKIVVRLHSKKKYHHENKY